LPYAILSDFVKRALKLPLPLLELRVLFVDHKNLPLAADDLAVRAALFYR